MEDTYCRILILNRFRFYSKSCGSLNYYHEQALTKISVNQKYTKYCQITIISFTMQAVYNSQR